MTYTVVLRDERDRSRALAAVYRAPWGQEVIIQDETRTDAQNARWWTQLAAIAKSGLLFDGEEQDAQGWHDVILHGYLTLKGKETGSAHRGLHGGIVIVGRYSSKKLSKKDFGELMDMTVAFIDEHGIEWKEKPADVSDYEGLA